MPEYKKPRMTNWYDPSQLIDTAKRTIISTTVGEYADPRSGMPDPDLYDFFDYTRHLLPSKYDFKKDKTAPPREEIWIDYAADVGDGFNPTYAVAYYMSQPTLKIDGVDKPLPRGELLFLGGDGVYPTANSARYEEQLATPYRMALNAGAAAGASPLKSVLAESPHIFALPGNHDWYDSLVAFKQLFCSHVFNERKFAADKNGEGGWRTRQSRSYFTLKLPQNWWLLAVDLQLSHNIDISQLQYFESVVEQMEKGDKIILCVPEPYWEKYIKYQDVPGAEDKYKAKEQSIDKLDRYFLKRGVEVKAYIAGDLHHYRRFQDASGVQKITAGGGGAFLHPTHDFNFTEAEKKANHDEFFKGFTFASEYPDYAVSKSMGWKDLLFPLYNVRFGKMTAVIYFALALLVHGRFVGERLTWADNSFWYKVLKVTVDRMIAEPLVILVVVLLMLGLVFFTDSNSTRFKWIGGLLHGTAHLLAAFVLGWLAYVVSLWLSAWWRIADTSTLYSVLWFVCVLVICGAGGYILGSIIMGVYLYISLHWFGRHSNEAFSALKIEDYKNFLRLHIDKHGVLTIYPIKIDKVPRAKEWVDKGEYFEPSGGTAPALIEKAPIIVR